MSDAPTVSVIMSMRNSAATIGAAMRSLQLQTLTDWELIVIDDGSADDSAAIVAAFSDPRIRLIRERVSGGLALRLNQAVSLSRGDFIARMDADDICLPNRFERQLDVIRNEPSLDVLACGAVVFNDAMELIGLLPVREDHVSIVNWLYGGIPLPHPTWFGRANWFRANPYDPTMLKAEDQDLLLRTYRRSQFGALDEVLLAYRQSQLDLKKLWAGRRAYIGALWRDGQKPGRRLRAMLGIATHLAKAMVDVVTLTLGLNRSMQRRRLRPVPSSLRARWRDLERTLWGVQPVEPAGVASLVSPVDLSRRVPS